MAVEHENMLAAAKRTIEQTRREIDELASQIRPSKENDSQIRKTPGAAQYASGRIGEKDLGGARPVSGSDSVLVSIRLRAPEGAH
jgi:hypothetical protein